MHRSCVISVLLVAMTPTFAATLPPDLVQAMDNFDQAQVHNDTRALWRPVRLNVSSLRIAPIEGA